MQFFPHLVFMLVLIYLHILESIMDVGIRMVTKKNQLQFEIFQSVYNGYLLPYLTLGSRILFTNPF